MGCPAEWSDKNCPRNERWNQCTNDQQQQPTDRPTDLPTDATKLRCSGCLSAAGEPNREPDQESWSV
eukprot:3537670-Lingulodinium_polyedra.AAC.1